LEKENILGNGCGIKEYFTAKFTLFLLQGLNLTKRGDNQ
jgi:hypothetical protein